MNWRRHLLALASITYMTLNLLFWTPILLALLPFKLLLPERWKAPLHRLLNAIYRCGVGVHDFWLRRVLRVRWPKPLKPGHPEHPCLVLCNHASWADALLVQSVMAHAGYTIVALSKRKLMYVPMLGLIFFMFDFPMLRRAKQNPKKAPPSSRVASDVERIRQTCAKVLNLPAAILDFAEGTRWSPQKHVQSNSPFSNLLPPRIGGFSALCQALDTPGSFIADITIVYPHPCSFWEFLAGTARNIEIDLQSLPLPDLSRIDAAAWLTERWHRKDELLNRRHTPS
ncbi:MAG: 1-acyl-sn-glycerol-3-phosphate acyltransferase [Gammaproteobacteria bacterium AqS3]|nr:1-acyl-sn-glycerol-3-phosphate acyltransferase [Gammaproteobacteria bacterium AqS3]